jgi:zinc/manganese transport system substrate-binding protein
MILFPKRLPGSFLAGVLGLSVVGLAGCGAPFAAPKPGATVIYAVGAENEYANVIAQIGGRYVSVMGILKNPNTDPHVYEADTAAAAGIGLARLVVQNGLGYDSFMNKLEAASPNPGRIVITVGQALGYGPHTPNPHLWYNPRTMPRVAALVARALERLAPAHRSYFARRAARFTRSLAAWQRALKAVRKTYAGSPVAVTEPVADYLLKAAGLDIKTPWSFQAAIMNGTDPSPQAVQMEDRLITRHQVRFLAYNRQAVDTTTTQLLALARQYHMPVVGVYETMPPHYSYQGWMVAETEAVLRALSHRTSTEGLL